MLKAKLVVLNAEAKSKELLVLVLVALINVSRFLQERDAVELSRRYLKEDIMQSMVSIYFLFPSSKKEAQLNKEAVSLGYSLKKTQLIAAMFLSKDTGGRYKKDTSYLIKEKPRPSHKYNVFLLDL